LEWFVHMEGEKVRSPPYGLSLYEKAVWLAGIVGEGRSLIRAVGPRRSWLIQNWTEVVASGSLLSSME
jgi:hypothetical protein